MELYLDSVNLEEIKKAIIDPEIETTSEEEEYDEPIRKKKKQK